MARGILIIPLVGRLCGLVSSAPRRFALQLGHLYAEEFLGSSAATAQCFLVGQRIGERDCVMNMKKLPI